MAAPAQTRKNGSNATVEQNSAVDDGSSKTPRTIRASAFLSREYVTATRATWRSTRYVQSLPNPTDRFLRDFGCKLYEEDMPLDAQIYSTSLILVMAVLAEGMELRDNPDIPGDDPDYEQSQVIKTFLNQNLKGLSAPQSQVLAQGVEGMLSLGHKPMEQVYETRTIDPTVGPQICLMALKPKGYRATHFVVDAFDNVLGLLPGNTAWGTTYVAEPRTDGTVDPNLIPRQKFFIPTWHPRDTDPRGRSHLASAYTPWWKKQGLTPEQQAFIARFAQPSLYMKLSPNAVDVDILNDAGQVIGKMPIKEVSAEELEKLRGGAVMVIEADEEIGLLEAAGDGKVFLDAYDHEDRQIAKAILMQTLATEEGQHMARAASQTHQDIFGIFIRFIRGLLEWQIQHDILYPLIVYNYGEEAVRLAPVVSLGDTEQQDWAATATAMARLEQSGYIHPSMHPDTDNILNLKGRDYEAEAAEREAGMSALQGAGKGKGQGQGQQEGDNQDGEEGDQGDKQQQ